MKKYFDFHQIVRVTTSDPDFSEYNGQVGFIIGMGSTCPETGKNIYTVCTDLGCVDKNDVELYDEELIFANDLIADEHDDEDECYSFSLDSLFDDESSD